MATAEFVYGLDVAMKVFPLFTSKLLARHSTVLFEKAFSFCTTVRNRFANGTQIEKRQILSMAGPNLVHFDKELTIHPGEFFSSVQLTVKSNEWLPLVTDVRTYFQRNDSNIGLFSKAPIR